MTDTTTAIATTEQQRALSPVAQVRRDLDAMAGQLKMALPSHVSVEKFQRVAMTAIQMDPELLDADRASLFSAITRAAQDGLLADKREGALVIFNSKKGKMVQWMPMVAGILKKVRQSGEIASISANVVHANDSFVWHQGDDEKIEHQPAPLGTKRGEPIGAYAIATLKDGSRYREVMDMDDISKVRGVSRAGQYGPWKDWWSEMAKKTVIRRLAKRLPMSTDLESVINDEATSADFARGAAALMGAPQRLSSAMLAQQAGATVEQADLPPLTERDVGRHDDQLDRLVEPEDVQDAEVEDIAEAEAAAEQTLAEIDGPLEQAEGEWDGVDPLSPLAPGATKLAEIKAAIDSKTTVIDLNALWKAEEAHIDFMPEVMREYLIRQFAAAKEAMQRREQA